jgi:hypothetical protein
LKQSGTVEDFIASFERLAFRTEGMTLMLSFESVLSVASRRRFGPMSSWLDPQTWVEATKRDKEAQHVVSSQNRKPSFIPRPKLVNSHYSLCPIKDPKIDQG